MRTAELATAAALAALSIFFMVYAAQLPIGWVRGAGPGGGAFPFWLSVGMLVCAVAIFVREFGPSAASRLRTEGFLNPRSAAQIAVISLALVVTIGLMHWVGTYVAVPLFLLFHLKVIGRHGWPLTLIIAIATPLFLFFFFEVTLKILLPKGITEPWFFPLYAMFF